MLPGNQFMTAPGPDYPRVGLRHSNIPRMAMRTISTAMRVMIAGGAEYGTSPTSIGGFAR